MSNSYCEKCTPYNHPCICLEQDAYKTNPNSWKGRFEALLSEVGLQVEYDGNEIVIYTQSQGKVKVENNYYGKPNISFHFDEKDNLIKIDIVGCP